MGEGEGIDTLLEASGGGELFVGGGGGGDRLLVVIELAKAARGC